MSFFNIIRDYKIVKENIGECSNGEIYKVCKINDKNLFYAMKKIKFKDQQEYIINKSEIKILENFHHDNIVQYIESFPENGFMYIIMEFCESDLNKFINNKKAKTELINEKNICVILKDIPRGLKEIHSKDIIHRDLKPANILIDSGTKFKIADFGIVKFTDQSLARNNWTLKYAAPEFFDENSVIDKKCDLWSLGCITCDLCSSEFPSIFNKFNKIIKIKNKYNKHLQNLIDSLLVKDLKIGLT